MDWVCNAPIAHMPSLGGIAPCGAPVFAAIDEAELICRFLLAFATGGSAVRWRSGRTRWMGHAGRSFTTIHVRAATERPPLRIGQGVCGVQAGAEPIPDEVSDVAAARHVADVGGR